MSNEPLEREPIDRMRARLEALLKANAAPRCGARSKRTGKPCQGAAMPNGRCKLHGGKSTGPRTPEGLERSRRANWKHGNSREAKAERSRLRAALLALRDLCGSIYGLLSNTAAAPGRTVREAPRVQWRPARPRTHRIGCAYPTSLLDR